MATCKSHATYMLTGQMTFVCVDSLFEPDHTSKGVNIIDVSLMSFNWFVYFVLV